MKSILKLALILGIATSCTTMQSSFIAPPYTSVSKIVKVEAGMSIERVNSLLGIQPYNIYTKQDDGTTILVYNYRLLHRKMELEGNYNEFNDKKHSEASQTAGTPYYSDEVAKVYILFVNDKVKSLITDEGKENASYILIKNNTIQWISKEGVTNMKRDDSSSTLLENGENGWQVKPEATPPTNDVAMDSNSQTDVNVAPDQNDEAMKIKKQKRKKTLKAIAITYLGITAVSVIIALLVS